MQKYGLKMHAKWLFLFVLFFCINVGNAAKPIKDVGVALYINDITNIQEEHEIIELEATLYLRWNTNESYSEDRYYYGSGVDEVLKNQWWPYFKFVNTRGISTSQLKTMKISKNGQVDFSARYSLNIESVLNMQQYPFDKQNLNIRITPFGKMPYKINYYLLKDKIGIDSSSASQHVEWEVLDIKNMFTTKQDRDVYTVDIQYERNSVFYIYKIFIPLMFILFVGYMTLWLQNQPVVDRLSVLVTAMLTIVAFQWVIMSDLPKVPYMTLTQAFVIVCYALLALEAFLLTVADSMGGKHKKTLMFWAKFFYPVVMLISVVFIAILWL